MVRSGEIKLYNTISEFYQALGIPLAQKTEFTIHKTDTFRQQYPSKSPLFRANYYTIVIIQAGQGSYILDNQTFTTQPCTIYFTNPGHIKGFQIEEPYQGYIITFSENFLKQYVHETVFDEFPFLLAETVPPHYLKPADFAPFVALCDQLIAEYQRRSAYKNKILGNLLVVFLLKIKEMFWDNYDPQAEGNSGSQIVTTFKQSLEAHFRDLVADKTDQIFQVQDFATLLGLHPNYLSTVIKSKTGKTVNHWIIEKTIAEAQAQLMHSQQSIKEIAYQLGFQEPSYFSKFFKKHTKVTPTQFRHKHQTGSKI
ncbi:helix-turn-helix domain-containing protein [Candidatus Leptofilum sp.]|uniref:helix-turn-helix domain-containing protein n=1 Tax=Candidatus Leptofilum sp. TaxID=3241576 RepID=UPI003B5C3F50